MTTPFQPGYNSLTPVVVPPAYLEPHMFSGVAGVPAPWLPSDNGLLAANYEMSSLTQTGTVMTAGTVYLSRVNIRNTIVATNIWLIVSTAAVGASSGTFAGIYSPSGNLLSATADIGPSLVTGGFFSAALTTPQPLTGGQFVWVALVANLATSQPAMRQGLATGSTALNLNLTAAFFRAAHNGTGLSALPASITPTSNVSDSIGCFWVGVN